MFKKILIYFLTTLAIIATGSVVLAAILIQGLPTPEQLENRQVSQSAKIYDRTGATLLYEIYGEEKRTAIPLAEIPETIKQATLAIEDSNFYQNLAFDIRGIVRALIKNLVRREIVEGGSTITQQLAKNAFLTPEKTLIRKIKELIVAFQLEKRYSKDEILNLYLNQIPYGNNAYGIQAAAQTFFNKDAKDLNLAEAALLASLPRATSYYSPWGKHIEELIKRKDYVLERMWSLGYINQKEKIGAQKYKFQFAPQAVGIKAPHFVLEVQDYLNKKYGENFVRTAGLNVITTLDWKLQQIAEKAVADGVARNQELYGGHNGALVAQHATTGQIVALVGSKNYFGVPEPENCMPGQNCHFEGNFNVASQGRRQPGSTMKPFAYATAFQKGFTPETIVFDAPTEFAADNPDCPALADFKNENKECFHPQNFDDRFRGPVTFRRALAQSLNIPSVKVLYLAGISNVLKNAKNFGITTLTEQSRYGLSLVLGGGEVILKELVGAYSVFAQEGIYRPQIIILKITDAKGNILEEFRDSPAKVMDPEPIRLVNNILTDTEERSGILSSSLPLTIFRGHEVALKTGTTNDYRDAWAIGYTPDLVIGVWAGNNDNTPMKERGSSILAAIPMWNAFLRETLRDWPLIPFTKPTPLFPNKAMLRGEYIVNYKSEETAYPHLHSILYYLDKNNPLGPVPTNPEKDPQFKNWEDSVLRWAEQNIPNFSKIYNHPIAPELRIESESAAETTVNIISPTKGKFISNQIEVLAEITAAKDIQLIQLFFNNELMDQRENLQAKNFQYQFQLAPKKFELQNLLTIKVKDISRKEIKKDLILFR